MSEPTPPLGVASNPGRLTLSKRRLKQFVPDLCPMVMPRDPNRRATIEFWRGRLARQLENGNANAAVVLQTSPFVLVACYAGDFDWAVVLRFKGERAAEFRLQPGSRLVAISFFTRADQLERDIQFGPRPANHSWVNFHPIIADFLSEDTAKIEELRATIDEETWQRCWQAGHDYLAYTAGAVRDGNATYSGDPAPLPGQR